MQPAKTQVRWRNLCLCRPIAAVRQGSRLTSVTVQWPGDGLCDTVYASVFIDATDTGELLSLAELPYRVGKEARSEFGEPDAPEVADPQDQQPITQVMALRCWDQPGPIGPQPKGSARCPDHGVPGPHHDLSRPHLPGRPPRTRFHIWVPPKLARATGVLAPGVRPGLCWRRVLSASVPVPAGRRGCPGRGEAQPCRFHKLVARAAYP